MSRCSKFACEDKRDFSHNCAVCDTMDDNIACFISEPCKHCELEFSNSCPKNQSKDESSGEK